ncbi:tetratricopeptide repeat protein [Polyangium sorediatum]|uniref:Tetratricopeptide repeat protein n=1 Tax=Polyangium sorediatum TaxID=889274 RepID=A0ABT6NPB7_9BACT|nr:hypothetical protein [Polyangium sorediatum]MDI1430155.1 hypothetical protein [Polyangium sorediatum]
MQSTHILGLVLLCHLATTSHAIAAPSKAVVRHPDRKDSRGGISLATELFQRGKQYMSKNEFRSACPFFEESVKLDPVILSKFALTKCYYETERYARAFELLEDIQKTAKDPAEVKRARAIAATIAPNLVKLTIVRASPTMRQAGLGIHLDGVRLDEASWQGSAPATKMLDIGEHVVLATAPGKVPWRQSFLMSSPDKPITIHVPRLADELPPQPAPVTEAASKKDWVLPVAGLGILTFLTGVGVGVIGMENETQRSDLFVPLGACLAVGGMLTVGSVLLWSSSSNPAKPSTSAGMELRLLPPQVTPSRTFASVQLNF